jgi:hypothetical protein
MCHYCGEIVDLTTVQESDDSGVLEDEDDQEVD